MPTPKVTEFDPDSGTIPTDWIGASALEISEVDGSVVLVAPSNNQTVSLQGVTLDMLRANSIHAQDATARTELTSLTAMDHDSGHGSHEHMYVTIGYDSPASVIEGFKPNKGDVIEIDSGVTASDFEIFGESGDALGRTARVSVTRDGIATQTILKGVSLEDLTIANFSADNQDVLNEIVGVLGQDISAPATGGYGLTYNSDRSNPPDVTGATKGDAHFSRRPQRRGHSRL
ncbi:hypothetical protein [Ruegeria sp. Ofav3-42]|uniref:hypothetical protein n=1 Tax=Ruegeria sp. Ofav3-42 TaxID=2917759 RepID=UPI001EF45341|nr:hypothetical protein [Ruegeria sp. Ofav3-42]MCG7522226.1 hypothetical protein [Ruegeria sp. Ofav3-42]